MNRFYWKLSFLLLFSLISCKDETSLLDRKSIEEKLYFEDYESPEFKWGYIDETGSLVVDNKYDDTRDFSEDLAAVNYQGKWGYINPIGELIIPPQYRAAYSFSDGVALVQKMDKSYGYINKSGDELFTTGKTKGTSFKEGFCLVETDPGYFYLTQSADTLNSIPYSTAKPFVNGLAIVKIGAVSMLINNKNEIIKESRNLNFISHDESFIKFKDDKGFGYISIEQDEPSNERYDQCTVFYNLVSAVQKNKEWFLINSRGEKLSATYTSLQYANEDKWIYQQNNKFGFINSKGEVLTSPIYDILYPISDHLSVFAVDNNWGYLDADGQEKVPAIYPLAWSFVNGYARIIYNGMIGFINKEGAIAITPQYIEVRDFYSGLARVQVYK